MKKTKNKKIIIVILLVIILITTVSILKIKHSLNQMTVDALSEYGVSETTAEELLETYSYTELAKAATYFSNNVVDSTGEATIILEEMFPDKTQEELQQLIDLATEL